MKKFFTIAVLGILLSQCVSVKTTKHETPTNTTTEVAHVKHKNPKLFVGIVVDQMRYDYLVKFYNHYGEGGFKRLIKEGYNLKNVHFNYIPTYTAVGHASVFTGTTPTNHGIISNNWYDKYLKKSIYCVDDDNYKTVGAEYGGQKSPHRMVTTTLTDQLKLAQNMRGKTIGISIKDRSAILPAGHTADAAYWFLGGNEGKFVTSTFYLDNLPQWVENFNSNGKANNYLNTTWNTFYDISTYKETLPDNNPYEGIFNGKTTPTFPYNLAELRKDNNNYDLLKTIPAGNTITTDFAIAAIEGENLGKSIFTDFLAISYSSTDYVGHKFGVNAKELQDTYIRMDLEIERLLNYLDENIGKENYALFLTADHAAVQVPAYLEKLKIPAGYIDFNAFKLKLNTFLKETYNSSNLIEDISNYQIFLNYNEVKKLNLDANSIAEKIVNEIINYTPVYKAVTAKTLQNNSFTSGILQTLQNGYNQKLSGDVLFVPYPSTISYGRTGSTHGSGYSYDTHVPLLFYGKGFKKGSTNKYYPITDIASTVARYLEVENPNGNTGKPILEVLE